MEENSSLNQDSYWKEIKANMKIANAIRVQQMDRWKGGVQGNQNEQFSRQRGIEDMVAVDLVAVSEEAKSTTWLHPVTGEAVVTGHRRQSTVSSLTEMYILVFGIHTVNFSGLFALWIVTGQQASLNTFVLRSVPYGRNEMKGFVLRGSYGLVLSIDVKPMSAFNLCLLKWTCEMIDKAQAPEGDLDYFLTEELNPLKPCVLNRDSLQIGFKEKETLDISYEFQQHSIRTAASFLLGRKAEVGHSQSKCDQQEQRLEDLFKEE
ncbi:hypothetical protein MJG53_004163, partial [Ovis ammon polii x Ovis aries]